MKNKNIAIVKGNIEELEKVCNPRVAQLAKDQLQVLIDNDATNQEIIAFNKDVIASVKGQKTSKFFGGNL